MIRKIMLPIIYFLFGVFVYFIEDLVVSPLDSIGFSHLSLNKVTPWIFIISLLMLIYFEVRPQFKRISNKTYKYLYLSVTVLLLSYNAYYWSTFIVWK